MSELSPKVEARDMELVPTSGRELCEVFERPCWRQGRFFVKLHRRQEKKKPQNREKTLRNRQKTP